MGVTGFETCYLFPCQKRSTLSPPAPLRSGENGFPAAERTYSTVSHPQDLVQVQAAARAVPGHHSPLLSQLRRVQIFVVSSLRHFSSLRGPNYIKLMKVTLGSNGPRGSTSPVSSTLLRGIAHTIRLYRKKEEWRYVFLCSSQHPPPAIAYRRPPDCHGVRASIRLAA